ncbi:MAG: cell wall hydrolase [Alphaproteobacteria bacterium]|nr:cell wall hydrolase [Alphaproteobacteria bacterium]
MIQTNDAHLVDEADTTVIDFKTAATKITTDRIAAALLHIAANENVRVIEALASTIVNALQSGAEANHSFVFGRTRLLGYPNMIATDETPKTAAFRRIARRALSQTLNDPTRGANAFHRIESAPAWSKTLLPIAVFGSFLFYRV